MYREFLPVPSKIFFRIMKRGISYKVKFKTYFLEGMSLQIITVYFLPIKSNHFCLYTLTKKLQYLFLALFNRVF